MLNTLKDKRDAGFFTSIAGLMASSTVLDLDAFERNTKAEGLGVGPDGPGTWLPFESLLKKKANCKSQLILILIIIFSID